MAGIWRIVAVLGFPFSEGNRCCRQPGEGSFGNLSWSPPRFGLALRLSRVRTRPKETAKHIDSPKISTCTKNCSTRNEFGKSEGLWSTNPGRGQLQKSLFIRDRPAAEVFSFLSHCQRRPTASETRADTGNRAGNRWQSRRPSRSCRHHVVDNQNFPSLASVYQRESNLKRAHWTFYSPGLIVEQCLFGDRSGGVQQPSRSGRFQI